MKEYWMRVQQDEDGRIIIDDLNNGFSLLELISIFDIKKLGLLKEFDEVVERNDQS